MPKRDEHMCWVGGQTRVRRVGPAMGCRNCRRFNRKHKCGGRPDYKTAWVDYPVEECAVCNPSHPRGEFPEGPSPELPPEKKPPPPKAPEPARPKPKAIEARKNKAEAVRRKRKRRQLLCLAVAVQGAAKFGTLLKVCRGFGVDASARALMDDLRELTDEGWLAREKVSAGKRDPRAPGYLPKEVWEYQVNPAVVSKIGFEADEQ